MPPITGAQKDEPHLDADWRTQRDHIEGAVTREMRNVVTRNGVTLEVHRADWGLVGQVEHAIFVSLRAGALSAWHMHARKTDHLVCVGGTLKVALYDDRDGSPTRGRVDAYTLSPLRPTLLVVPPGVWHGVQNVDAGDSTFVNYFDIAYDYRDPDEWRLPPDTDQIPFRF